MELKVQTASVPDRENLVAEIWFGDQQLAEVSRETETLKVEIYKKIQASGDVWELDLDDLLKALEEARSRLS